SVSGKPGDVLEYCIRYVNIGVEAVRDVRVSDPIPFFAEAKAGSYHCDAVVGDIYWVDSDGNAHCLTYAEDTDEGRLDAGIVYVSAELELDPGKDGLVCYRARIR
ncbi:MAG: hypothetical protein GXN93_01585, partial [Candidatus Diapherotrites archaeon]|nr:hypothetical protein [Candidatus Diapherotrites archaeon]